MRRERSRYVVQGQRGHHVFVHEPEGVRPTEVPARTPREPPPHAADAVASGADRERRRPATKAERASNWRGDGHAALRAWYERALATLSLPHDAFDVPTPFGTTHVIAVGPVTGDPVVLLHGMNANALAWKPQLAALGARYRVYAPDIIGSAGLSAPTRLPERGPAAGQWLADVLDGLGVTIAHIMGISGGSWNVLKFASAAPERVRSAVLLSPNGFAPVRFPFRLSRIPALLALIDRLNGLTVRSAKDARGFLTRTSAPGVVQDEETLELFAIVMRSFRNQPPPDTLPEAELRRVTAPTLVLLGEREIFWDPHAVIAQAHRVLSDLRAAEIVQGAGHALASDRPAFVNERLLRFLGEAT